MASFKPDLLTAFGMMSLAAFTVAWMVWILGRQYWKQGMSQTVMASLLFGFTYVVLAMQSRLDLVSLQVLSKVLLSLGISTFSIALLRFRQSSSWRIEWLTLLLPLLGTLLLAVTFAPEQLGWFNRSHASITLVQMLFTVYLLLRMRSSTPGLGWILLVVIDSVQVLVILPMVFVGERPSPEFLTEAPLSSILATWLMCLMMFLNMIVASMGFLIMLRDRQAALEQHRARLDPLTELPNRAAMVDGLRLLLQDAVQRHKPISLLLIDIDHFKAFNDMHGHLVGDQAIQQVARTLQTQSRESDLIARYGGEEFVMVLPNTSADIAQQVGQRLCDAVRRSPLELPTGQHLSMSISVGVHVSRPAETTRWQALVASADAAMYQAKQAGRDRVVLGIGSLAVSQSRSWAIRPHDRNVWAMGALC